jgi:hypothetical protein
MKMPGHDEFTLHRKPPDAQEDKVIGRGSKAEMLAQYKAMPRALQKQASMMLGSMEWNYLEIDNIARNEG